jgi:hypothetical protein
VDALLAEPVKRLDDGIDAQPLEAPSKPLASHQDGDLFEASK